MQGMSTLLARQIPAHCVCKLVSVFERPYRWEIEVWGTEFPYAGIKRVYQLQAIHEQAAAQLGMEKFSHELPLMRAH